FRQQPRLRGYLESVEQARGQSGIAFSPFLPTLGTAYSVGGFDLNVGGEPIRLGKLPGFTVVPPGLALPVGLHLNTGYELAEALRGLDLTEEGVAVADAALVLAIGLKCGAAVEVVEPPDAPEFGPSLADCLERAVRQRREFQVARRSIQVAQEGTRVAHADF